MSDIEGLGPTLSNWTSFLEPDGGGDFPAV
jgi:hypothetical protein